MIKNILYVEDGSVDVDELQESIGKETKIIIYRQGYTIPTLKHLPAPIKTNDEYKKEQEFATNVLNDILDEMSKRLKYNRSMVGSYGGATTYYLECSSPFEDMMDDLADEICEKYDIDKTKIQKKKIM